ncbi:MAG: hypothetical protein FRX48_03547 [Lasallia pustulata]|uniref:Uncharacterized protein n=1 Tax=Lasallia pustulata TaxID=136370 RepID=A0A5M8PSK8_9LECA|nr:MAG: hypothetical protein FRX48_03547 [Lasallia pustulata]
MSASDINALVDDPTSLKILRHLRYEQKQTSSYMTQLQNIHKIEAERQHTYQEKIRVLKSETGKDVCKASVDAVGEVMKAYDRLIGALQDRSNQIMSQIATLKPVHAEEAKADEAAAARAAYEEHVYLQGASSGMWYD